jgi:hypothetical protein
LGCDQYIWYVFRLLKHWVLILIVEVLFVAGAVFAFDFQVEGKDYSDYALTFRVKSDQCNERNTIDMGR